MVDLHEGFAAYLAHRWPDASAIEVTAIERIYGGASRETYRVAVRCRRGGIAADLRWILRRDPASSLIETDRTTEFDAYTAFHGTAVPVPRPLFLETDGRWLDRPFFVMEEVVGAVSSSRLLGEKPYCDHLEAIGEQKWRILGEIARTDPAAVGLLAKLEAPALDACWRRELDYWEHVIDEDELTPQPIARAAIRWLRRTPPPPARRLSVVHGDYRTGNFLFDATGRIRAILDWEMCHLGDPLEDLAWALDPLWSWPDRDHPGKLIVREQALAIWQRASGITLDRAALGWWEIFASVKGLAIWISSGREFADGRNQDPIMVLASWFPTDIHDRVLVDRLRGRIDRNDPPATRGSANDGD
ncbi:MAG TPA: phosphotransferase family protein [Candidatus Binatia bacterium]|nr:phosphotransferase family protein [Candidatus Binatia bacterium]